MKSDRLCQLKLKTLDALLRLPLYNLPMENMDWAKKFDTWKSTKNWRVLPLKLDDGKVHHVSNLNYSSASFYCMHFFNIVRHHIIFIFNAKWPISSYFFCEVSQNKSMIEENRQLVTNEPIECEGKKRGVEVQDCRKSTVQVNRNLYNISQSNKEKPEYSTSTCNRLDFETLGSQSLKQVGNGHSLSSSFFLVKCRKQTSLKVLVKSVIILKLFKFELHVHTSNLKTGTVES